MIRYELPYPPTANNLFVNAGRKRVKSGAYRAWQAASGYAILSQRLQVLHGPVSLSVALVRPDKRKRDLSNTLKAVEDILVHMNVIEDDSMIQRISAQWVPSGPECVVLIQTAEEALAA